MYSFYGGKQGRSYKIVGHYDSIYDMVKAFQAGGSYTDVGYDEYVIIDTIFRKNQKNNAENGIIYRRGYDFNQKFYFAPEGSEDSEPEVKTITPADKTITTLKAADYNITYQSSGQYDFGDNPLQKENVVIPKYYNYKYKFIENNGEIEVELYQTAFNQDAWNKDWNDFVEHPGGGAIYIGQIVGPEGDSPAVEVVDWNSFINHYEDNVELIKGQFAVNPKPGYDSSSASEDGYDQNGYHDTIQYGYCTIRDAQGQITGAEIAFDIPYTVFKFNGISVSPYDDTNTYGTYDEEDQIWKYHDLIKENADSIDHPYYKNYSIFIPQGIHGQDITQITIDGEIPNQNFVATYRNYDGRNIQSITESIGAYKVINQITGAKLSNNYQYNQTTSKYNYPQRLTISYTNGNPVSFDYSMIEKVWYQEEDRKNGTQVVLRKGHVYVQLSTGTRYDCGILKQIERIEKDDGKYYIVYNYKDNDNDDDNYKQELPITEIEKIAFDNDLLLIRFKNVEDESAIGQTYSYNGTQWVNLGSLVRGNHIFTNFATYSDLTTAYPNGLSDNLKGWIVTVGPDENQTYTLYAFDYLHENGGWYPIQELGANNIYPQYSIVVAKNLSQEDNNLLNDKGVWFVVTD